MISEQKVKEALRILTDPNRDYAKTRAAHEFSQRMEKVVLARIMSESNESSMAAKEAYARKHDDYVGAIENTREIAELDYHNRAQREAAATIVETWRTEQSNERAHTRYNTAA